MHVNIPLYMWEEGRMLTFLWEFSLCLKVSRAYCGYMELKIHPFFSFFTNPRSVQELSHYFA